MSEGSDKGKEDKKNDKDYKEHGNQKKDKDKDIAEISTEATENVIKKAEISNSEEEKEQRKANTDSKEIPHKDKIEKEKPADDEFIKAVTTKYLEFYMKEKKFSDGQLKDFEFTTEMLGKFKEYLKEQNEEIKKDFENLQDAKDNKHIKTDILDKYASVLISKKTICKDKEIYKVKYISGDYILKAINNISQPRLDRITECFNIMKKLGDENPYFIKGIDIKTIKCEGKIRVEVLMEDGGKTLHELMKEVSNKEILRWIVQSVDAFMYSEDRRICHFDIKPQNMVYKNGILKVIDLDSSIEFDKRDDLFKKLRESGKMAYEFTRVYAPIEVISSKVRNQEEWIGGKHDVYCWAMSFYQIITKNDNKTIDEQRKNIKNEEEYNQFADEIKNNKKLIEFDEKHIVSDVIFKCLSFNPEKRPKFRNIKDEIKGISEEVYNDDLKLADTNLSLGTVYQRNTINLEAALYYNENAMHIILNKLGKENTDMAILYNNIASIYRSLGNEKKVLEYNEKALKIQLKFLREKHTNIAKLYNNIASIYCGLENKKKASEYREKSSKIELKLLGKKHIGTAGSNDNFAIVYSDLDRKKEILQYYEGELKIQLKLLEEEHINTAKLYRDIALVYSDLGDKKKQLKYFEKALKIRLKLLGEEHSDTAALYCDIANVYYVLDDIKRALEYHEKALKIRLKLFGEKHTDTAASYNYIASIYKDLDENKRALEYHEKALKIRLKMLGEGHTDTATSYNNIALICSRLGDKKKALEYHEKALKIRLKLLGEEHTVTADSYNNAASVYSDLGDKKKALEYYEKALRIRLKLLGDSHIDTAKTYLDIGSFYNGSDNKAKASEFYEKALTMIIKIFGADNPTTKLLKKKIEDLK